METRTYVYWKSYVWPSDKLRGIAPVKTVVRYVNVHYDALGTPWENLDICERSAGGDPDVIARWKITYEPDNPEKPPVVEVIWSKDK